MPTRGRRRGTTGPGTTWTGTPATSSTPSSSVGPSNLSVIAVLLGEPEPKEFAGLLLGVDRDQCSGHVVGFEDDLNATDLRRVEAPRFAQPGGDASGHLSHRPSRPRCERSGRR